jgi:hypothetical protein
MTPAVTIYVVVDGFGEHADRVTWPSRAYTNEADAQAYVLWRSSLIEPDGHDYEVHAVKLYQAMPKETR